MAPAEARPSSPVAESAPPPEAVQPSPQPEPVASSAPAVAVAVPTDPRPASPQPGPTRPTRQPATRPSAETSAASTSQPEMAPEPASPAVERSPVAEPTPEPALEATAPAPTGGEPQTSATAVTDPESGVLLVLPDRASAAGPTDSGDPAESYVQSVATADGGAIELSGIAWSETGPFALINGRVVGPGSTVGAYTLEAIRPGHVVLAGEGRRIQLNLQ